ncbi:MAG: hypothetical protein WCJ95_23155, partial [Mariniphaga sp.]
MGNKIILIKNLIDEFEARLSGWYSPEEIRQIVYMLFEEYLGWPKTKLHLSYTMELPGETLALFAGALEELCTGKPNQYILGKTWFNGMILNVDSRVL